MSEVKRDKFVTRNLLCIKDEGKLNLGHQLLYKPYKKILEEFFLRMTDVNSVEFDPVSRVFDGIESAPEDVKYYYEALLGISSYYQHSQGGRGKYIEKRLSSVVETCSANIKASEFPLWFTYPAVHRKRGIFTYSNLSREEKSLMRNFEWDYLLDRDETTDLGNIIPNENTVVLLEIKNRVDSGGTAGRREIWTSKFSSILEIMVAKTPAFRFKGKLYSIPEVFKYFNFNKLEVYIGVLFGTDGRPATLEEDRAKGFYSSNKDDFGKLVNKIQQMNLKIQYINKDMCIIEISPDKDFTIRFGSLYGNDIPKVLFRKDYPIEDLLILKYDDIWLSQLIAIKERENLLKYGRNCTLFFANVFKRDSQARKLKDEYICSEGSRDNLEKFMNYFLSKYSDQIPKYLIPADRTLSEYVADLFQVISANEA